jgi:hypothetical protein
MIKGLSDYSRALLKSLDKQKSSLFLEKVKTFLTQRD